MGDDATFLRLVADRLQRPSDDLLWPQRLRTIADRLEVQWHGWQPIATAPLRQLVLTYCAGFSHYALALFGDESHRGRSADSHWQPLPPPPTPHVHVHEWGHTGLIGYPVRCRHCPQQLTNQQILDRLNAQERAT